MAGQKKQRTEADAIENGETKVHKKHKNKQKRKLEDTDAEFVAETEKDVVNDQIEEPEKALNGSKKKKNKLKEEETLDAGSAEISKKKKKNKKEEGQGGDGVSEVKVGDNAKDEVIESSSGVVVSGKDINDSKYKALNSFVESGLPDEILECCKAFDKPSPIQSHSWPFLLDGRDFIGIAATGSGILLIVC